MPEPLHGPLQPQELVRLQKEVQVLQEKLAGITFLFLEQLSSFLGPSPVSCSVYAVQLWGSRPSLWRKFSEILHTECLAEVELFCVQISMIVSDRDTEGQQGLPLTD